MLNSKLKITYLILFVIGLFIFVVIFISGKKYMAFGSQCNLVDFYCSEDEKGFNDIIGCGCKKK